MKNMKRIDGFIDTVLEHFCVITAVICVIAFIVSCFIFPAQFRDGTPTTVDVSGHALIAPEPPANATNVSITRSTVIDIGASSAFRSSQVNYYIVLQNEDGTSSRVDISRAELGTIDIGDLWYDYSYQVPNQEYESGRTGNFVLGFVFAVFVGVATAIPAMLLLFVLVMLWNGIYAIARAIHNRIVY